MRSTRFMGKKIVGRPMRSPSGSLICRMKWSKEFKSMPRNVIPEGLMASSSPHTFSLGVCRLTTTMECGSIAVLTKSIANCGTWGVGPKENCGKIWLKRKARVEQRMCPGTSEDDQSGFEAKNEGGRNANQRTRIP